MTEQSVDDLLARLERERADADRLYNEALTAVDGAIQSLPRLPDPPAPYDAAVLTAVNRAWDILPTASPVRDRSLKGRLRAFIWRVVGPPLENQKQFNAFVVDHLNRNAQGQQELPRTIGTTIEELRRAFEALIRFESLLVQYLQSITLFVDTKDRTLGSADVRERLAITEQRLLALKRDVARFSPDVASLATGTGGAATAEAATYVGFEDRFRGPQQEIRRRVEDYLPILSSTSDVIDVGCGRGELLELLKQRGISARGVDVNLAMVELCRDRGLMVDAGDAVTYLAGQPDSSVGGLVAIQVVEHFEPTYLAQFLQTAHDKMRPGAPLILETINPACWMAFFETYIRDLTHQRPLHPETLRYLVQATGFQNVDIQFRQPVGEGDKLDRVEPAGGAAVPEVASLARVINAHADKLNARLFSSMDYVVVGRR